MRSASIDTTTFWIGPAGHGPLKVIRRPSYEIPFAASWCQTMSGSGTLTVGAMRTSASR